MKPPSGPSDLGIRITSETFTGIHGGFATFHVTADASELEDALATLKEALVPVAAALEGLPAGLRADAEVAVRIGDVVWTSGEGRAIGDLCEDAGRMRVQRISEDRSETCHSTDRLQPDKPCGFVLKWDADTPAGMRLTCPSCGERHFLKADGTLDSYTNQGVYEEGA